MDAKLEKLETALNGINVLNAGKKREEAVETFKQLLPEVESFQAEIQRMQQAVSQSLTMQCRGKRNAQGRADRRAPQKRRAARKARSAGEALRAGRKAAEAVAAGVNGKG